MTLSLGDLILLVTAGGLLGTVGQGIRVVVGLKKTYDDAMQNSVGFMDKFSGSTLLFSLLIGFVSGVLGILTLDVDIAHIKKEQIMTLFAIGYAGADFIEGFVKKNTAQFSGATATAGARPTDDNVEQPPMG